MKISSIGVMLSVAVALASFSAPSVHAGITPDDPGTRGQVLIELGRSVCDGDRTCEQAFVRRANQCTQISGNTTGAGVADCILSSPALEPYNLDSMRDQIIQGVERAFALQSETANDNENISECSSTLLGFPAWNNGLQCDEYGPQITQLNDIWIIVLNMIRWLLAIAAYGAAIFIIWGGFKYMKSQGDPSGISSAKTTITQAIGGLFIALISTAIVWYVQGLIN